MEDEKASAVDPADVELEDCTAVARVLAEIDREREELRARLDAVAKREAEAEARVQECLAQTQARARALAERRAKPLYESNTRVNLPRTRRAWVLLVVLAVVMLGGGAWGGQQIAVTQTAVQSVQVQVADTLLGTGDFAVLSDEGQAAVWIAADDETRRALWPLMGADARALAREGDR